VAHSGVAGKKVFVRSLGRKVVEEGEIVANAVSEEDGDVDFEELCAVEDVVETGMEVAEIVVDVEIVVSEIAAAAVVVVVVVEFEINV
jgi:hypothetical protein